MQNSRQKPDISTKCQQTDSSECVHQIIQTEPQSGSTVNVGADSEESILSSSTNRSGSNVSQKELVSDLQIQVPEGNSNEAGRWNKIKTAKKCVPSRLIGNHDSNEKFGHDFNHRSGLTTTMSEPTKVEIINFDVGISIKDMNLSAAGKNINKYVEVDPKDYALTLTPQVKNGEQISSLDNEDCDAEVIEILNGEDHKAVDATADMIGDSDEDDVIEPTQESYQLIPSSKGKTGRLKHKLSISENQIENLEADCPLRHPKSEKEADCSDPKQLKFSNTEFDKTYREELGDVIGIGDQEEHQTLSVPREMNRIVARSGQKLESVPTSSTPSIDSFNLQGGKPFASVQPDLNCNNVNDRNKINLGFCQAMFSDSEVLHSKVQSRLSSFAVSLAGNRQEAGSQPTSLQSDLSLSVKQPVSNSFRQDQGISISASDELNHEENSSISSALAECEIAPIVTTDFPSVRHLGSQLIASGFSASTASARSDAPVVESRSLLSELSRSCSSSVVSRASHLKISSMANSTSNTSFVPPTSLSNVQSSTDETSVTLSTASEQSATSGDSEPSFLQKYREIVSKIKPVSELLVS